MKQDENKILKEALEESCVFIEEHFGMCPLELELIDKCYKGDIAFCKKENVKCWMKYFLRKLN